MQHAAADAAREAASLAKKGAAAKDTTTPDVTAKDTAEPVV